ncbi:MAG: DUF1207 domain-containing protein [Planctomycetales bacterium]|nr:DUF1207 domain-containing protein [Planctomycetales bacterium]
MQYALQRGRNLRGASTGMAALMALLVICPVNPATAVEPPPNPLAAWAAPGVLAAPPATTRIIGPDGQEYIDADAMYLSTQAAGPLAYHWQWLPDGLLYRSYLAGTKEPRFGGVFQYERDTGWLLDVALGGRAPILRYGTTDPSRLEGWQLDLEGAAFPRLDLEDDWEMLSSDFRFGVPLTVAGGPLQAKLAYYHLSSHLGDELILRDPGRFLPARLNFSRDVLVAGAGIFPIPALRLYGEAGWAMASDVARPWEFQFGFDYSPVAETLFWPAPFAAMNVHLREEVDYSGTFAVQAGAQWRGRRGHLLRVGGHFLTGPANQYEFFHTSEEQIGLGIWYDY